MPSDLLEKPNSHTKSESANSVEEVLFKTDKKVRFETTLNSIVKEELVKLLKYRIMTFAWDLEDVTGVDLPIS